MESVCVVGLGKLGAPLAAVFASRGHRVVGIDKNAAAVQALNAGLAPVQEPGLQELIDSCDGNLSASGDFSAAVPAASMSFVVVPTPSKADGSFSLDFVIAAVGEIGNALRDARVRDHTVVVTSTVSPGSTAGPIRRALEDASGMTVGRDIGLCYSPEFIALGSVVRDILQPDLVMVGASDAVSAARLGAFLSSITENRPPVVELSLVDAEVAKLAVNTFVTTKISYANMLAEICERLPGADAYAVTRAVGLDSRIGLKYLQPATSYGGPCFPRDNAALAAVGSTVGVSADIALATDNINRRQLHRLRDAVLEHAGAGSRVAVLGLSYKPGTVVSEESSGVGLARLLQASECSVSVYDPLAMDNARLSLGDGVEYAQDVPRCIDGAAVIVITTPWEQFRTQIEEATTMPAAGTVVIDCWRIFDVSPAGDNVTLIHPGQGPKTEERNELREHTDSR